jgi:hypothetical protein
VGVLDVAWLLLGVAAIASLSGYAGSALSRRRKQRRPHQIFLMGLFVGALAGSAMRRRPLSALASLRQRVLRG